MKTFTIATIGGCLLAAGAARAADRPSSDDYLQAQRFENIPYRSGGVGVEERDRLKSMAADDNLELSFFLCLDGIGPRSVGGLIVRGDRGRPASPGSSPPRLCPQSPSERLMRL